MSTKPTIRLEITAPRTWRFFWVKYVTGFDPAVHCARCLRGMYSKHFRYPDGYYLPELANSSKLDEHESPWLYICGVTSKWDWNLHIAGRAVKGRRARHQDERITVELENFERIPINASHCPPAARAYRTCRNWQFGWQTFPGKHIEPDLTGAYPWSE